ncbi:hypothetical protein MUK42_36681 [Musa troglodytarum]|uniref:Uncharacterized protein n=1 Tax=Musa troglodytarum TaxID=320322 RepID=A0A9E7LAZ8_9LILI|nr:hypothetical protein MUK42_36681 [Musa troglodytarum]
MYRILTRAGLVKRRGVRSVRDRRIDVAGIMRRSATAICPRSKPLYQRSIPPNKDNDGDLGYGKRRLPAIDPKKMRRNEESEERKTDKGRGFDLVFMHGF